MAKSEVKVQEDRCLGGCGGCRWIEKDLFSEVGCFKVGGAIQ